MTAEGGRDNLAILALANVPPFSCGRISKPRGQQVATTEPVVANHGREVGGFRSR
jgi:hypothetical protein